MISHFFTRPFFFYISLFLGKEHYVENNSEIVEGNFKDVISHPIKEETLFDEEEVLPDYSFLQKLNNKVCGQTFTLFELQTDSMPYK